MSRRRELLHRWREIQDMQQDDDDPSPSKQRVIVGAKEQWFSDSFDYLINQTKENHIWCRFSDLMGPLLETFHNYFDDNRDYAPLRLIWKRVSQELSQCTLCICQHHQAQETYNIEYESDTVDPLLKVLHCLDEERVTEHLKEINARIGHREYDPDSHSAEVVSLMFEVLMFPILLDDQSLVNEFQIFIETVDNSHEVTLAGNQQYPGVYALLFLKNGRARAIGLRLAGNMGKLRRSTDLEPLQPLLKKYIGILETEVLPSTSDTSRPRVQLERITVWLGIKTLLGFLEAPAFEEGIMERYPIFLSIVLNHVSDDTPEFSHAVTCLKASFEMLGCKLWLRTTLSPSMMRNTLLGQCFHTRHEKSHKEIFDLFVPFLQSLEALQDGEHEKQRRHFLYFLLHQVPHSSNFSLLMKKNASKIALLIIHRGYTMNPPSPPFECAHMWGPSLVCSLKDTSLHSSLRQPAFDLIQTIIISDASALISLNLKKHANLDIDMSSATDFLDDEDELPFSYDVEEKDTSCWNEFSVQSKFTSLECKQWICIPLLWLSALVEIDPSIFPISFSKAAFWALSHISMSDPHCSMEPSASIRDWLSAYASEISSSFEWQVPNGSDDGGDGLGSRNSVKAPSLCIPLLRTFKRFAVHFLLQVKLNELHKQWTWEPRMAESLVLLLIDPNDCIRPIGRGILEYVSKTTGLTTGLQFLCSSASSLSAIFVGLRCASKQIQIDFLVSNFPYLQHLFFIMHKLLEEVVASPLNSSRNSVVDPKFVKMSSEGGFLRQPFFNQLPVATSGISSAVVDIKSWEKFSCLLSSIMWPSLLKCLAEGKKQLDNAVSRMTCVRLLEILPVTFERLSSYSSSLYGSPVPIIPVVFDFKWLGDLVDWGRSSLDVINRYWKKCMFSLLNFFKDSHRGLTPCMVSDVEEILSRGNTDLDQLKERVFHLTISLSSKASRTEGKSSKAKPLLSEPSLGSKGSLPYSFYRDKNVKKGVPDGGMDKMLNTRCEDVIVLSDDELEKVPPPDSVVSSSSDSGQCILHEALSPAVGKGFLADNHMESVGSCLPGGVPRFSSSGASSEYIHVSSQKKGDGIQHNRNSKVEHAASGSTSSVTNLKGTVTGKEPSNSVSARNVLKSHKEASCARKEFVSQPISGQLLCKTLGATVSKTNQEVEKVDHIIKEVVRDTADDPLERALDSSRRPPPVLTNIDFSVPRRKVIQLQMPTNDKNGPLNRMYPGVRRLKPPKLDEWFRSILEMNYFAVVGLSSSNQDEKKCSPNLKAVPLCFNSPDHYVQIFRPLVLEEFKAQLYNSYMETGSDEICRSSLSVISVERIDDFLLVQGRPDEAESAATRGFSENDLVLLTKEPLKDSVQRVHVLGKVVRREKNFKSRSIILVIRFYLPNFSSRLNTVKRLLTERSKWFLNRLMSLTSQLREFQALSSLQEIPMLPIILNPVNSSLKHSRSRMVELNKLSQHMQEVLKSSFNQSQLEAISVAIKTQALTKDFELSLIQGPPGTGKTRTIVAIVSALLALQTMHKTNIHNNRSGPASTNAQTNISQSAAIARAWQDAAFARQMIKDSGTSTELTERTVKGRVLICAQSNAAVDELVSRTSEGIYGNDGKVYKPYIVRVGNAKTVHPNSMPFFIDTLVEQRIADDMINQTNAINDMAVESSSSLRARLEKLVDSIRSYESMRAKIEERDNSNKISSDDGTPKQDGLPDMSDAEIGAKLNILYGQKREICRDLAAAQTREKKVSEESRLIKHKVRKSILREAEIVITTLSGCGGDLYGVCSESASSNRLGSFSEQTLFDVVIIDEAAQALEPATLIPLQLLKSSGSKCIMVGDPKQLPATVLSNVASKFLYECSMFERLQRAGHPVIMLTEQYRMHPEICRFPSSHFYENKLLNGSQMTSKSAPFHENIYLGPYVFYDIVDGRERHGKHSGSLSLYNESEVKAALAVLKLLKKRCPSEFTSGKIGVITPYRSQLSLARKQFSNTFGPNVISDMEFNTVDGFQGREVDILILSTVRASDISTKESAGNKSGIGFVADVRRMNVALTRARLSLWIFGNARTLQTNLHWDSLIRDAKERNLFISITSPYQSIFDKSKLESQPSHPKRGKLAKDVTREVEHRGKDKGGHGGKVKCIDRESDPKNTSCFHDRALDNNPTTLQNSIDLQSSKSSFKNVKSTKNVKLVSNCKEKRNTSQSKNDKEANVKGSSQRDSSIDSVRNNIVQGDVQLEVDSSINSLISKPKGRRKFSEHAKGGNLSQRSDSNLPSAADGTKKEVDTNNGRSSNPDDAPRNSMASRKRQRDAVDALLSSSLISSKKPETSSKPGPVKRQPPEVAKSIIKKPSV